MKKDLSTERNASILATILFCSARGGSGMKRLLNAAFPICTIIPPVQTEAFCEIMNGENIK